MRHLLAVALDWANRCFPEEQMRNPATRSLRVFEESAELAQACHVPYETALQCLKDVYVRPKGEPVQEIGGVLMTIYLFVAALGHYYEGDEPGHYFAKELRRVLAKPPKHFADRNAEKIEVTRHPTQGGGECPTCGGNCGQCGRSGR